VLAIGHELVAPGVALAIETAARGEFEFRFGGKPLAGPVAVGNSILVSDDKKIAVKIQKPNILFIMGDDIGWMQPSIYHRGLMVGKTPNIDRIGNEGGIFMTYYAEQSCTAGRNAFFTGMHPLRTGMIPPQLPGAHPICGPELRRSRGSSVISATLRASSARTTWATIPMPLPTAHGFQEFWGYLYHLDAMQGVSFP
jgi:arylsulfatase A-like enzyme